MRLLVIGAGGLGAPALLGLGARGFQSLTLLDPDRVELQNLHRQILYRERDVGRPKVECAAAALASYFPGIEIDARPVAFCAENRNLVAEHEVVLDATDGFETKLALNDACVDHGVPYVFGGVVGHEGQAMAVLPGVSACVRCLFEEAPPPGAAPTCAELGILGPVAGIVAAKQVELAVALAAGERAVLDRIWIYDGQRDRARDVALRRASDCRGCGFEPAPARRGRVLRRRARGGGRARARPLRPDLSPYVHTDPPRALGSRPGRAALGPAVERRGGAQRAQERHRGRPSRAGPPIGWPRSSSVDRARRRRISP